MRNSSASSRDRLMSATALRVGAILTLCSAMGAAMHLGGAPDGMVRSLPLVMMTISFWAFGVLPEALTGLVFLLGAVTLAGFAPSVVFSGFATTAFWLIFAGTILSAAATRTGLSHWLAARFVADRFEAVGYGARVATVVLFASALALILPSTLARVAILMPLVIALSDLVGYRDGGRARTGLVLAAAIGTYIVPITFLPANLPNIVLAGSLEALYGVSPTFGSYMLLHFPVIGLVKGVALVGLITLLFAESREMEETGTREVPQPLSGAAFRLMIVLAVTLGFWSLDALHAISPAWIGLAAAVLCMMPFMRVIDVKAVPFDTVFPALLYIAAVLSLGAVLTESGAGAELSRRLVDALPLAQASDFGRLALLALMATITAIFTTMPVAPAITTPFFAEIAASTGWSIEAVGMSQVLGYATPLFPYQLPPVMLAVVMTGIAMSDATRVLLWLAAVTTPVTLIAAHQWWQVLGWY